MDQFTLNKPRMKRVNCSKPGYASIISLQIEHIPYNLIFATKYTDFSILITIIMERFEFVVGEWICSRRHNTNPGNQILPMLLQADQPIWF